MEYGGFMTERTESIIAWALGAIAGLGLALAFMAVV